MEENQKSAMEQGVTVVVPEEWVAHAKLMDARIAQYQQEILLLKGQVLERGEKIAAIQEHLRGLVRPIVTSSRPDVHDAVQQPMNWSADRKTIYVGEKQ